MDSQFLFHILRREVPLLPPRSGDPFPALSSASASPSAFHTGGIPPYPEPHSGRDHFRVNILWTFAKRVLKSAFSLPTTWETFSEGFEQAAQARKCKWSVNFLEKASKNRVPVAYAVRGFFSVRHRSKRKNLSDQIESVIAGRKISSPLNKKICEGG